MIGKYNFYGWETADVRPSDELYGKAGTPRDLYDALSEIWCADTCAPRMRDEWSEENKTLGQCSITAFLVQDIYGGQVYGIKRPGGSYHCYNEVDGRIFDLTSEQFGQEAEKLNYSGNPVQSREEHFEKLEKRLRYELLRSRLQEKLGMFPKMRRFKQQQDFACCYEILEDRWRGILSLQGDNGYPHAVPMDFYFDKVSGRIYFHCARQGYKIDLIRRNPKASFTVHDDGFRKEGDWALNITSVICYGRIRMIDDPDDTINLVRKLGLKYYPAAEDVEEEIRKAGKAVLMLEFTVDRMTGKLVNES